MGAVRRIITHYCTKNGINKDSAHKFFTKLQAQAFKNPDTLLSEVTEAAQLMWTSPLVCNLAPGHKRELCSIINDVIREDSPACMPDLIIIAKALNDLCVVRRPIDQKVPSFPPGGICWRGGVLPDEHRSFYVSGKKYRVPGFLATSFDKNVSQQFLYNAWKGQKFPPIQWQIKVHPKGAQDFNYKCKHVNLVLNSHVGNEVEFLFAAYSVFTVTRVTWSANATDNKPHVIQLEAAIDNSKEPEDLPLAPWY